jgi:hypothetical protein
MSSRHKYCRVVKRQTHPPVSGAERRGKISKTNHSVKVRILPLQLKGFIEQLIFKKCARKGAFFWSGRLRLVVTDLVIEGYCQAVAVVSLVQLVGLSTGMGPYGDDGIIEPEVDLHNLKEAVTNTRNCAH